MTDYRDRMSRRNQEICEYYAIGHSVKACGQKFGLNRQRVYQILKRAGVSRPREKTGRTKFLGVSVDAQTKTALKQRADQEGVSVSKLASDALDALVKPE